MENKWVFEWVKHEMYEVEMMWNLLVCRSFLAGCQLAQCVKTQILGQKLLFDRLLQINEFVFLSQNSKEIVELFIRKSIKYMNFHTKNRYF